MFNDYYKKQLDTFLNLDPNKIILQYVNTDYDKTYGDMSSYFLCYDYQGKVYKWGTIITYGKNEFSLHCEYPITSKILYKLINEIRIRLQIPKLIESNNSKLE